MEFPRQDDKRWKTPARRVDTLNRRNLFAIAWLCDDCSTNCVRACDNFRRRSDAYYKASLVTVIGVFVKYAVRLARLRYKLKTRCDCDMILTTSALAVEFPVPLCLKLRLVVNPARHPVLADR